MNTLYNVHQAYCPTCKSVTEHTVAKMCVGCGEVAAPSLRTRIEFNRRKDKATLLPGRVQDVLADLEG